LRRRKGRVEVLKELGGTQEALEDPQLEQVELPASEKASFANCQ
jgi:hypothetical protein